MGALSAVSTILPSLSGALTAFQTLGNVANTFVGVEDRQAVSQLRERQALEAQQQAEKNALERERLALEAAQNEDERRAALRRAVARQRANFGSQGVGAAAGSSQAVLLGLFDETEDEINRRTQLDSLRNRALDLGERQASALNLLQATQLAQRQRLNRLL